MTYQPEQALWKAVLTQASRDIFTPTSALEQKKALAWVYTHSQDYQRVCHMAGIQAKAFRMAILEALFFKNLIQKGELKMEKTKPVYQNRLKEDFALIQKAKALFRALYSQQDLEKAIGKLSFQDCLNLCRETRKHIARFEKKQTPVEPHHA